jgi:hypothetical protein
MRLRSVLLSSKQRPSKLLQQRHRPHHHSIFHRRIPDIVGNLNVINVTTHSSRRHCRRYQLTFQCHRNAYRERLQEGEAPDSRRRRCPRRRIGYSHSHSSSCDGMAIRDGEAPKEAQGTLRGADLPNSGVPQEHRLNCIAHGKRGAGTDTLQVVGAFASVTSLFCSLYPHLMTGRACEVSVCRSVLIEALLIVVLLSSEYPICRYCCTLAK